MGYNTNIGQTKSLLSILLGCISATEIQGFSMAIANQLHTAPHMTELLPEAICPPLKLYSHV